MKLFGVFESVNGKAMKMKKWNEIAIVLNDLGPAIKKGSAWKKSFNCIKSTTKTKVQKLRQDQDNGRETKAILSEIDKKLITMTD